MRRERLLLEPCGVPLSPGGVLGERLDATARQWLLCAPEANPAMLALLRDRDRTPRRDLVPWAGEFAGKYLTALVQSYRLTGDERLRWQLDRFVPQLIATQADDGYFGPAPRDQRLTGVTAAGHDLWDVWGHYHLLLGLLLWHETSGSAEALEACRRSANYLCGRFIGGAERAWDARSHEMNQALLHVLPALAEQFDDPRIMALAEQIVEDFARPPAGDYVNSALAGKPFWECPKPRWESLHPIQGILELHRATGDPWLREAFERLWWSMLEGDRHNTGGFTAGEQAVGNPYHPGAIETCCTVAWTAVSVDLLRLTGNPLVADELELSLYNGLLGGQVPSGRWSTYNTPSDGVKRASAHEIVFQAREGSPELNCCSVNAPRGPAMLCDWGLMTDGTTLYVNAYGPSAAEVTLGERRVGLRQQGDYPISPTCVLTVTPDAPATFALAFRIPSWSARTRVVVAGGEVEATAGSYLRLEREWRPGDRVELEFDFSPHCWVGEREVAGQVSLYRGPLLLAFDPRFNEFDPEALPPVSLAELALEPVVFVPDGGPAPWLLLRTPFAGGRAVTLCDFAGAGWTGRPYRSWLPAVDAPAPQVFDRERPVWCRRALVPDA